MKILEKQDTFFKKKQIEVAIMVIQQKIKDLEKRKLEFLENIKDKKSQLQNL